MTSSTTRVPGRQKARLATHDEHRGRVVSVGLMDDGVYDEPETAMVGLAAHDTAGQDAWAEFDFFEVQTGE